jgi:Flp pilus assembly pilin Flp
MVNPRRAMATQRRSPRLGERGQALEYALIIALIGVGLVSAVALLAGSTKRLYSQTSSATILPESNPASNGGMAMTIQSPSGNGAPGSVGAPPGSSDNAEPSDSSAAPPDSLNSATGTQTVGMN